MVNTYFSTASLWYFCENGEKCILNMWLMKYTMASEVRMGVWGLRRVRPKFWILTEVLS
jgi:hypothetical protein